MPVIIRTSQPRCTPLRFVPTLVHGIADYLVAVIVIALPFIYRWPSDAAWPVLGLGGAVLLYSLMTDYELGALRYLSMGVHLFLDLLFAAAILAVAWLVGVPTEERWPLYAIGLASLVLLATTRLRARGEPSALATRSRA